MPVWAFAPGLFFDKSIGTAGETPAPRISGGEDRFLPTPQTAPFDRLFDKTQNTCHPLLSHENGS
jgi:hypothetical protein